MSYSFKDFRQRVGISQKALGNLLGLSREELSYMENQQRHMPLDIQNMLAKWESEFAGKSPDVEPESDHQFRVIVTDAAKKQLSKLKKERGRMTTIIKRSTRSLAEMQEKYRHTLQVVQFYDFVLASQPDQDNAAVVYERRRAIHTLSKCSPVAQAIIQDRILSAEHRLLFLQDSIAIWEARAKQ